MSDFQARQGDVFFTEVGGHPKDAKRTDSSILAHGEATGHAHKIMDPPMSELESYVDELGDIYVKSPTKEITVGHEEHGPIKLPADKWIRITRQFEYDVVEELKKRRVAD